MLRSLVGSEMCIRDSGNIRGPVPGRENAPSYIDCALGNGYDVEIDVRVVDGELWLGHDKPQYKVTWNWIFIDKIGYGCTVKILKQLKCVRPFNLFVMKVMRLHLPQENRFGCMIFLKRLMIKQLFLF